VPVLPATLLSLSSYPNAAQSQWTQAPATIPLPATKAMTDSNDTGTTFTDAQEPENIIGSGDGEIVPNDDDSDETLESEKPKRKGSSFGYAFLIMLLTIAIAVSGVWFYRKYRVRQMQYREFEVRAFRP
jgi:hypothetical protein